MRLYAGFAFSDFPYLFRVNVQPDFYIVMPWHRLIAFGTGDDRGFSTAGLTKALAYIHLDCQDVSLCCHFNVFRVLHLHSILHYYESSRLKILFFHFLRTHNHSHISIAISANR